MEDISVTDKEAEPITKAPRTKQQRKVSRVKRRLLKHVWVIRGALLLGLIGIVYGIFLLIGVAFGRLGIANYPKVISNFLFAPTSAISSIDGRTNILVLGKGGAGHEAPDLTDTMMFVSLSDTGKGISIVSLPRDIWIPTLRAKLNSAYYWGNQKQEEGGLVLAKSTVEEIVGQPVHYAVVVDFGGFKEIIDDLGGLDVNVERSFIDNKFPVAGKEKDTCNGDPEFKCRYETISFEKGLQHMDGQTALNFVRSRNAEGEEGTDLAREARQQKVIKAMEKKMLSPSFYLSPKKVLKVYEDAKKVIETDITSQEGAVLLRKFLTARQNTTTNVLGEDFLVHPQTSQKYDNLYVFIPKTGNWDDVHKWVESLLPPN